ncbi:MAG: hypothetical protein HYV25_02235 [Candidatus Harrisonbacteria bacterium]|nr:hypothetical protein [Candidatus Harrisonbacteria bacterium]
MSDFRKFLLVAIVMCVAVGIFAAQEMYRGDPRQIAVVDKALACDAGTDDAVLYAAAVVGLIGVWNGIGVAIAFAVVAILVGAWGRYGLGALAVVCALMVWFDPLIAHSVGALIAISLGSILGAFINVCCFGWRSLVGKRIARILRHRRKVWCG